MADRYWVGGTGTWNAVNTANWSASSGGATGASVPTSADNVFFDANSNVGTGAFTVTLGANVACLNCTIGGPTALDGAMTLAFSTLQLAVNGNWSNQATNFTTSTAGGTLTFSGTGTNTVTTNGVTFAPTLTINKTSPGTITLNSAFTTNLLVTHVGGGLVLNGFTLTCRSYDLTSVATRSISFGSSNIVLNSVTAGTTILTCPAAAAFTFTGTGGFTRNQAATATIAFAQTSGGSTTNAPNFSVTAGASALTITSGSWFRNLNFTGSTSAPSNSSGTTGINIAGVLTLATGGTYTSFFPNFRVTATLDTLAAPNNKTLFGLEVQGTGITVSLARATTISSITYLTEGTLDLNGFDLSTGSIFISGSTTRSISFGLNNINLTSTTAATSVLSGANATNFTYTGTGGFVRNQAATATVAFGTTAGSTSNAPNLTVNAGASALTITANSWFKNLNFTGSTCTASNTVNIAGVLTLATGGTYTSLVPTFRVTATLDTLGKTLSGFGVNGTGITVSLAGTVTCTGTLTLTEGTLNLNGFDVSVGIFSSSVSTARSVSFGSNNINLTSTATILSCSTATNFTWTGTGGFVRNQLTSATVTFGVTGGTVSNAPNLTVNAGASALTITSGSYFKNLIFTGSTCTVSGTVNIAGNVTLASGGTYTSFGFTARGTSLFTSSGKTCSAGTINQVGASLTLADAFSSTNFTLIEGTLYLSGFSLTSTTSFATGAGTKNITFDGGTIVVSAATTTAWNNANPTGFTTTAGTGTGTISMIGTFAKTFVGGGSTYDCTLNQGGAGTLTITGSNTFNNITNTTQPATVLFTAGTTNTFNNFSLSGTSGNLITIGSVTAASHTLSKASGTVSVSFCSISNSSATGGAAWEAYTVNGNVDGGNNTGWSFAAAVIYDRSISESSNISESVIEILLFERSASETSNALDLNSQETIKFVTTDEFANAFDSIVSNVTAIRAIDEEATAGDLVDRQLISYRSIDESAFGLDSVESLLTLNRSLDEFANAQDSQSSNSILVVFQSESAQADDEVISFLVYPKSLSEQASIDSANNFQVVLGISAISETANIASNNSFVYGSFPVNINELATGSDASSFVYGSFPVNISETALALDSFSKNLVIPNNIFEEALAGDLQNYVLNIARNFSDQANISSSNNFTYAAIPKSITEFSLADDAVATGAFTRVRSVANIARSSSAVSREQTSLRSLSESARATDLTNRNYIIQFQVDDAAATIGIFQSRFQVQPVQISENLSVSDLNSWAYYWTIVVDTQTANWQNVVDTQAPVWVTVQDTQTPSWQNVTDTQSPSWSDVGTNQTPNWQQIN